jgi:putative cell wall-binding protein
MLNAAAALTAAARLKRAAGPTRYGTAVALSQLAFPTGATTAYVASGETFADALSTGALTARAPGPILLTDTCALPPTTATELARLKPKTVYVVGGADAVCPAVLTAVSQAAGVAATRVAGADRYATDAALAAIGWPAKVATVYVTTGVNFPDGLTGSARAAKDGSPILLTDTCTLPPPIRAALVRLAPTTVKVIGGALAVCPAVLSAITAAVPGAAVTRIAGASRVDTAVKVAQDGWTSAPAVIVASAANFPDALSAGAYAALTKAPLLINDACSADPEVGAEVAAVGATSLTAMGGSLALCGAAVVPLVLRLQS